MKSKNDLEDFLSNNLSKDEMIKIEEYLINSENEKELLNSILSIESDEISDDLIGPDEEFAEFLQKNEEIIKKACKNFQKMRSIEINNKNQKKMEKINLTSTELTTVTNRFNEIHTDHSDSLSIKDNLVTYYQNSNGNLTKEEAEDTVSRLMAGVEDLTSKYKIAIQDGFIPTDYIAVMTKDMNTQERYDFLVNAIAVVQTLNIQNLKSGTDIKSQVEAAINELNSTKTDINDGVCDELQIILGDLLETSSLMLTGEEQIKEMMNAADGGELRVVDFASSQYDDFRYKSEMALATWIEYEQGSLNSIPANAIPEAIGVSTAAGIEEAQIMSEVFSGSKNVEWAVKCLKILGGVALVCFLGYVALLGISLVMATFFEAAIIILGTSGVAVFFAAVLTFLATWGCSSVAVDVITEVVEWSGKVYDFVVEKLRESIIPKIKDCTVNFLSWVRSLCTGTKQNETQTAMS